MTRRSVFYMALASVVLVSILSGCAQPAQLCLQPDQNPACTEALQQRLNDVEASAVSVAIIDNHRIVSQWAYGTTEHNSSQPVTPFTPFQAGDLSQLATLLGVLAALQELNLDLDTPVNPTLRDWQIPDHSRWSGDLVTVRHLLTHRSGLTPTRFLGYPQNALTPTLTEILQGQDPATSAAVQLAGEPGVSCHRSAAGYEVLAYWLEQNTDIPFPLWQLRTVFTPLNIPARYRLLGLPIPASGYNWQGQLINPRGYRTLPERGSSGLWATPSDIAQIKLELLAAERGLGRIVIQTRLSNALFTPYGCSRGLGVTLRPTPRGNLIEQRGLAPGYRAQELTHSVNGQGAVIMVNSDRGDALIDDLMALIRQQYGW